jgi:hypothetical protein
MVRAMKSGANVKAVPTLFKKALLTRVKVEVAPTVPARSILSAVSQMIVSKEPKTANVSIVYAEDP